MATNELIILGLVSEKPLTGYDIKKICKVQFMHYSDVNTSSIYSALKRLEKERFIEGKNIKEGHLIKKVFKITEKGKKEFEKLETLALKKSYFPKDEFNVGLSFADKVEKAVFLKLLSERLEAFRKAQKSMEKIRDKQIKNLEKKHLKLLIERGMLHIGTEIKWIEMAKKGK